jgi:hypothetical protein
VDSTPNSPSFLQSVRTKIQNNRNGLGYRLPIPGSGGMLVAVYRPSNWEAESQHLPRLGRDIDLDSAIGLLAADLEEIIGFQGGEWVMVGDGMTWKEVAEAVGEDGAEFDSVAAAIKAVFPSETAIVMHAMALVGRISIGEQDLGKELLGE